MNRRKVFATVLCVFSILALVFGGCNKAESTPDEATTEPQTESTTVVATSLTATLKETESETESEIEEDKIYVPDYNYIEQEDEEEEEEEPKLCTVNVDGKAYTYYVGDTINYVFYLKTPEALEDFQATTNYDSGMLELLKTDVSEMFPIAGSAVICNTEMMNIIKFNAIDLSGMDFTGGGNMISLEFKVLDSGSVAIGTTLEYMDSVKGEPYVSDYKIIGDIEYSEEII